MKRSEMLQLMWSFIESVEHDYDIYMTKNSTEKLLTLMERAGMLPPAPPYPNHQFHVWEPENE